MKISKIERAAKNKALYHLYADDTLLMTISEDTLVHFNLQKGQTLSAEKQQAIYDFDQVQRCLQQAYRYLARRNHFKKELQRKLHNKGYASQTIEQTLQILQEKNYLNDTRLTIQFIHDGVRLKQYGPNLLKQKLFERGVPSSQIDEALAEHYPETLQEKTCVALAQKKFSTLKTMETTKARQKLASFLQQRGFYWETIQPVLERLFAEQPEQEGN